MRILTALFVLFFAASAWATDPIEGPIGEHVHDLPLFDAHMHYKEPAWGPYPPASVIELMDKTGVRMALVSSTPDEGTIRLWQLAPERIVPEIRPYRGEWGSSNWTQAPDALDYIVERLDAYPHTGIGEFHIHRIDMGDEALFRAIAKTAVERDLFLHVHSGHEPVEWLFQLEPGLKIIWAHAGLSTPADTVYKMLEKHETLYADTSYRERDILLRADVIAPAWRDVIERFPDRLMIGSDTWVNAQWDDYEEIMKINRQWLANFPREIAEQIAYKNAERLFGREVGE